MRLILQHFFLTVFNIRSYVIYLVRFSASKYTFKISLGTVPKFEMFSNLYGHAKFDFALIYLKKTALVKKFTGLSTEMLPFTFQRKSFNYAIICYPFLIKQPVLNIFKIYHFDI